MRMELLEAFIKRDEDEDDYDMEQPFVYAQDPQLVV